MIKSIVFSIIASLESIAIIFILSFKYNGLIKPFLGFSFLIWIWSRIMRFNASLNVYLFFSLFIPIPWLLLDVFPRMIQSADDIWNNAIALMLCPCIGLATWIDVILNRIIHGTLVVIPWPFSQKEK